MRGFFIRKFKQKQYSTFNLRGTCMSFFLFICAFLCTPSAMADENTTDPDWLSLTHNYYWFAIEDSGNMDLFARAKYYLAQHLSPQNEYTSIDCGALLDDNAQAEDTKLAQQNINVIGPADSHDILLSILPFIRNPMTTMGYNAPTNVPLDIIKKDIDVHALALDLCFQEDIAHDTHGSVFPMSRFLEGTLFQDARAYGIYEIIDDPSVMASTSATEKLIADIERTMPNESNFAVVITSTPQNLALENESYYIFNGSERFYNYPFGEQNASMDALASELLSKNSWKEQKEVLSRLDATSIVWMNIERKETQKGDAFYEHQTHILDHENRENILKHMGFSLNKTDAFWPSVLTLGILYFFVVFGFIYLYRNNYFLPYFKIEYKKNKASYVQSLIFGSPLLGFFGYLFLASFLVPLQPSLENLWFVSFWWPVFSFIAIFITPLIVYWPLKTRLSNLFSYNFDDFFPIFSFLAFFGASLHLISNFFFVYEGWELVGVIFCVLAFIAILATFVHSRKSYSAPVSVIILLIFAFLSVLKAHVLVYVSAILVLLALRALERAAFKYLEYAQYHKWTEIVWAQEDIHEWTKIIKQLHSQIQTQKETTDRQTFAISVERNTPTILFFNKLQQEIDKKNNAVEHLCISLCEPDEDIYNFQRKLFGQSQDIGDLIEQGFDDDPIAAQNKIFQNKLAELASDQEKKEQDLHIYIENYDNLSKRTAEQLEAFLTEQKLNPTPSKIFVIGTKVQRNEEVKSTVPALEWERIKEISADYISEEIMEWIEKEAKSEAENDSIDFNGELTLRYLLQKIEYLIWYHNKDIQDTAPGIGDPMDVIQKGFSANIISPALNPHLI